MVVITTGLGRTVPARDVGDAVAAVEAASPGTRTVLLIERGGPVSSLPSPASPRGYVAAVDIGTEETLITAIRSVAEGSAYLSPAFLNPTVGDADNPLNELTLQQREVLQLVADGLSNAAIAERLVLSPKAVENHIGGVFRALHLNGRDHINRRVTAANIYNRNTWL